MFCRNCGKKLDAKDKYCGNCGTSAVDENKAREDIANNTNVKVIKKVDAVDSKLHDDQDFLREKNVAEISSNKKRSKLFITMILIVVLATVIVKFVPELITKGTNTVSYIVLNQEQIPEKLNEILPRYKTLERALSAKVDNEIYLIVTRGEKLTAGYDVDIEKIELIKEGEETKLVVHAIFKDPNPDELVTQSITYPYVVVKTDLEELPTKIDLEVIKLGE